MTHPIDGEGGAKAIATRKLVGVNPDRLKYETLFVRDSTVPYDAMKPVREFVEEEARILRELTERILAAGGDRVRKIILFGSRARGEARPDSDYDLLILLGGDVEWDWHERTLAFYRALRGLDVVAEPHVMQELRFEEEKGVIGGLAYPANKEGVVLYAGS